MFIVIKKKTVENVFYVNLTSKLENTFEVKYLLELTVVERNIEV